MLDELLIGKNEMLWCSVCCEPYHSFCILPEDLPLSNIGKAPIKEYPTWCCRRCSLCKVCGLPSDSQIRLAELDKNSSEMSQKTFYSSDKDKKFNKDKLTKEEENPQEKLRKRLRCVSCGDAYHSDCIQPSQQKLIKAQGSEWVNN